jgi:hypothetical protein
MKMIKTILLFLLGGCSYFVGSIDTELVNKKNYLKNIPEIPTYCKQITRPKRQLISTNVSAQIFFQDFIEKNAQYDFIDQFALWSLLQLAVRPDQSSPSSRLQLLLQLKSQSHYFDFFSENPENQFPLLYGIEWVLKKFNKKTKLEFYANIIDTQFPNKFKVEKNLELFLIANKERIKDDQILGPFYIRGAEVLKENEKVPKINFLELIKFFRTQVNNQKIIVNTSLTSFKIEQEQRGSCNYDFNLYNNSIFLIDRGIPDSNLFGLASNNDAFMAATSQKVESIKSIAHFPLYSGDSKVRSSAVCIIENQNNLIWAISNFSRDPGQHLFHLIRYGLARSRSASEVDHLIRHSRHLFLSDPVRLIIESNRSRSDQIENLLKLNLPIYNADILGNIWAYTQFNSSSQFIIDDRNQGSYFCK